MLQAASIRYMTCRRDVGGGLDRLSPLTICESPAFRRRRSGCCRTSTIPGRHTSTSPGLAIPPDANASARLVLAWTTSGAFVLCPRRDLADKSLATSPRPGEAGLRRLLDAARRHGLRSLEREMNESGTLDMLVRRGTHGAAPGSAAATSPCSRRPRHQLDQADRLPCRASSTIAVGTPVCGSCRISGIQGVVRDMNTSSMRMSARARV